MHLHFKEKYNAQDSIADFEASSRGLCALFEVFRGSTEQPRPLRGRA